MSNAYLLLLLLVFSSCAGKQTKSETGAPAPAVTEQVKAPAQHFERGALVPSVALTNTPTQSFALYMPKTFSDSATIPVAIIFFDPHGDGTVPLNLYKDLADQYRVILFGSNSSKNGMDMMETKAIAANLLNDACARFGMLKENVTYCGFSGGAKVALLSAAESPGIKRVIYCGAAVPIDPTHPLSLLGFAGTKDMNYTDVVAFDRGLQGGRLEHYLVQWQGKHEFPDAKTFKDAFEWLGSGTITGYEKKQATISAQKLAEEQGIKQQLLQAFETKDLTWWKNEIASLNLKKKADPMYARLLGFVSLACYSYSGQALQINNLKAAEKILAIYALADPGNKDCENFTQQLRARQGK